MMLLVLNFTACREANTNIPVPQQVETTELIRTLQSWDGVELPDYFEGRPELVAVKYVLPLTEGLVPCCPASRDNRIKKQNDEKNI